MHAYRPSMNAKSAPPPGALSQTAMYAQALRGAPSPGMPPPPMGAPPAMVGSAPPPAAPQAPMGAGLAASPMRATLQPAGYGNAVQRPFGGGGY